MAAVSPRIAYLQVSVALPPLLVEGLLENYTAVKGSKATFAGVALYALKELAYDLSSPEEMAEAGIPMPEHNPDYRISIPKSDRTAKHGFYSMKVPEDFRQTWWELLKSHDNNGPAVAYRAMLHLYRSVYAYYVENEPDSPFLAKYPSL